MGVAFRNWFKPTVAAVPDSVPSPDQRRSLALYKYDTCGYCARVLRAIERIGLEVELRDVVRSTAFRDELLAATGRTTVPCLVVDGAHLFESSDIVAWLEAYGSRVDRDQLS